MTAAISTGAWVALAIVLSFAACCTVALRWPHLADRGIARLTMTEHLHDDAARLTKENER